MPKNWIEQTVNRLMNAVSPRNALYQNNPMRKPLQECILAGFRYYRAEGVWSLFLTTPDSRSPPESR